MLDAHEYLRFPAVAVIVVVLTVGSSALAETAQTEMKVRTKDCGGAHGGIIIHLSLRKLR